MSSTLPILPPATLGIFGGGQLGRMFALAARRMGYRIAVYSDEADSCASQVSDWTTVAPYTDPKSVEQFCKRVAAVSIEFENIPSETLKWAAQWTQVHPGEKVLHVAQDRIREKSFFCSIGIPSTPFVTSENYTDKKQLLALSLPFIFKTAGSGYDGKGQQRISKESEIEPWLAAYGGRRWIAEQFVPFEKEFSVIGIRNSAGDYAEYEPFENDHANHILDVSLSPAEIPEAAAQTAKTYVHQIASHLGATGVICVEFFLLKNGEVWANEIAPRPHNSGHLTIEGTATSQFEQQVRALCSLPLGSTKLLGKVAMANLMGDLWKPGEPRWDKILAQSGVSLHLYGKTQAKPGRKMGHLTLVGSPGQDLRKEIVLARSRLQE